MSAGGTFLKGVECSCTYNSFPFLYTLQFDWKRSEMKACYLDVPSVHSQLEHKSSGTGATPGKHPAIQRGPLTLNMADSFQISTLICSTKLTQNGKS